MGRLIYSMSVSLDGYVADAAGSLEWVNIDEEVHQWFNDQGREADAFLEGRGVHELMAGYWPFAESDPNANDVMLEWARIWLEKPKIVFSTTLPSVEWNSRLVRGDPVGELDRLRREFPGDLSVSGPTLAAAFIERDLVTDYRLVVHPVVLGGGKRFWPPLDTPLRLELFEQRRFASGAMLLAYRRTRGPTKS